MKADPQLINRFLELRDELGHEDNYKKYKASVSDCKTSFVPYIGNIVHENQITSSLSDSHRIAW